MYKNIPAFPSKKIVLTNEQRVCVCVCMMCERERGGERVLKVLEYLRVKKLPLSIM